MITCTKCGETKDAALMARNSRNGNPRKVCKSCDSREAAKRGGTPESLARRRERYWKNREVNVGKKRKQYLRYRDYYRKEAVKRRHEFKVEARMTLRYAVLNGSVTRPTVCEKCGRTPNYPLHGHHEDYTKPLDVVWLCRRCHAEIHRTLRAALAGKEQGKNG